MGGVARHEPYGSAADIPSIADMLQKIEGGKLLTRFIARDQRAKLVELERQVREHIAVIDQFYAVLGPRNWIVHDELPMPLLEAVGGMDADDAERRLIGYYQDPENLERLTRRLSHPELRVRSPLIERAKAEFLAGRYNTCVLLLLSVMDGFVNDVDASRRRGLHARDPDEMVAWDSVVGHHMGLAHAHASFTKTFKKTSTDEVRELYRHGIVHGMLVNYDNEYVGAKAWNRLCAVRDWATSMRKAAEPPKPQPSFMETMRRIDYNRRTREALDAWTPGEVRAGDEGFDTDEVVVASRAYLDGWMQRNYGAMGALVAQLVAEDTPGRTAGMVREAFEDELLTGYELQRLSRAAAAVAIVDVILRVGGEEIEGAMRWIRHGEDGMAVAPNEPGRWGLMSWTKWGMIQARRTK
jgi:hypothetical protein